MDGQSKYQSAEEVYFAAKPAEDVASNLLDKSASFFNLLRANAYLEKLQRMWRAYHGAYDNDLGFGHRHITSHMTMTLVLVIASTSRANKVNLHSLL